jgi:hypothetical protein
VGVADGEGEGVTEGEGVMEGVGVTEGVGEGGTQAGQLASGLLAST